MTNKHTLTFDNDCGFCTKAARWLEKRSDNTTAVAYQHFDHGRAGLTQHEISTAAYFIDANGRVSRGTVGMGRALLAARAPWKFFGWPFVVPPFSWLAQACYPLLARYRHKLPGGTASCKIEHDK